MGSKQFRVRAILDASLADKCKDELKRILESQDKRIYTVTEDGSGNRLIDDQKLPSGNSIEEDITNLVLIKNGFGSLSPTDEPFYFVEIAD